jgi:hypothetical protein
MAPIRALERISREVEFADEAEARRYLKQQVARGYRPSDPFPDGIVPHHRYRYDVEVVTWQVAVEKQIYNGETTPAYREGDRVVAQVVGDSTWQPVEGTISEVHGHKLKVRLDSPNPNRVRQLECQDYEVRPIPADAQR